MQDTAMQLRGLQAENVTHGPQLNDFLMLCSDMYPPLTQYCSSYCLANKVTEQPVSKMLTQVCTLTKITICYNCKVHTLEKLLFGAFVPVCLFQLIIIYLFI